MSRQRRQKKRKRKSQTPLQPAMFSLGTKVRVKAGTFDEDYADIPLGGWIGTVQEVDDRSRPRAYLIEWHPDTLERIDPVQRERCQRDQLDLERFWLDENVLELDGDDKANAAQPAALVPRRLSKRDRDDRIRMIFGLTSDEPLPANDVENLRHYHSFLNTHLSFPFPARFSAAASPDDEGTPVMVLGLLDFEEDDDDGLMCAALEDVEPIGLMLAELEAMGKSPNRQLLADYAYWFFNSEIKWKETKSPQQTIPVTLGPPVRPEWMLLRSVCKWTIWGAIVGTTVGAPLAAITTAQFTVVIGALLGAFFGCWGGSRQGRFIAINDIKNGTIYGGMIGTVLGAVLGAMAGILLGAIVGVLLGILVSVFVGAWILPRKHQATGVVLGAFAGGIVQACITDLEGASLGAGYGAIAGAIVGLVALFVLFLLRSWLFGGTDPSRAAASETTEVTILGEHRQLTSQGEQNTNAVSELAKD